MSSANITREKLREILQCSLCLEMYKSPRGLNCFHTFCDHCIQENIKVKEENGIKGYNCPYCFKFSPQSETKPNFHITQLLDLYHETCERKTCVVCEESEAVWKCMDCVEYFCTSCKEDHLKVRVLRHHKMEKIENLENNVLRHHKMEKIEHLENNLVLDRPIACQKHPNEFLKYNCTKCEVMLCITCALVDHKGHNYETIEDALKRYVPSINEKLEVVKAKSHHSQIRRQKLKDIEVKINSRFENSVKQAKKQRDKLMAKIASGYEKIEKELAEIKNAQLAKVKKEIDQRERQFTEIDAFVSSTENILQTAKEARLLHEIQTNVVSAVNDFSKPDSHKVPSCDFSYPSFETNDSSILGAKTLGRVKAVSPKNYRHVNCEFEKVLTNNIKEIKSIDINFNQSAYAHRIAYDFNRIAICCSGVEMIKVYKSDGKPVTELRLSGRCKYICSSVFISEAELAVAADSGLYLVDINTKATHKIADGNYDDVSLHGEYLYVLQCGGSRIHKLVNVAGQWQQHSCLDALPVSYWSLSTLVVTSDSVFVCDGRNSIQELSHDGEAKSSVMSLPHLGPSLLAVNNNHDCLVAHDISNPPGTKLYVYKNGEERAAIALPGVKYPRDVIIAEHGTFWILDEVGGNPGRYKLKKFKMV